MPEPFRDRQRQGSQWLATRWSAVITIACSRAPDIRQAMQAAGRFVGARDAFPAMAVEVAALA